MSVLVFGVSLLVGIQPHTAHAQGRDTAEGRASFVVRLGHDTVAFETFTRTANRLTGDIVMRPGLTRLMHYDAALLPDGSIRRMELTMRSLGWRAVGWTTAVVEIRNDSAFTTVNRAGGAAPIAFADTVHRMAMPMPIFSYAIFEAAIRQAKPTGPDTVEIDAVWFPRFQAGGIERMRISNVGPRKFRIRWNTAPIFHQAEFDSENRMTRFDGLNTTVAVDVERVAAVGATTIAERWATADNGGRTVAAFSIPDTARATLGHAQLQVVYTAPLKRGRKIFGSVVKFDSVWRTGANQATVFTTSHDLEIAGTRVPAGSYSLWTIPRRDGATLIINSQTGQWGTNHDPAQDLVRVSATVTSLARPVDRFNIRVEDSGGNRGRLVWAWDDREFGVPIVLR